MAEKYSAREGRLPRTWENGGDVSSDSRWWCSGFFPGVLWYVYENGRNPRVLEYARMYTARVEREKYTTDNHDVGFMLYCSFGNGCASRETSPTRRCCSPGRARWRRASSPKWG